MAELGDDRAAPNDGARGTTAPDFNTFFAAAPLGVRRSLELAHAGLLAGGLPVGAVLIQSDGRVLSEGRNRAYDPAGGADVLQRTAIAHAEMNALATVDTETELTSVTLWSSHRPCAMCAAACAFVNVGALRFVAPDPSDDDHTDPDNGDQHWIVVANLLFLAGIRGYSGPSAPMLSRAADFEAEVIGLLDVVPQVDLYRPTLAESLASWWPQIDAAARRRAHRVDERRTS